MASDLISRSAVIDVLKETGIIQDNDLGHLVVDEINRIPLAYDVDAVVEQVHDELFTYDIPDDIVDDVVRKGGV